MVVAEIVARFAGSPLAVTQLRTGAYRIGTAPNVDLALQLGGMTSFPLVEWIAGTCVVRLPVGITGALDGPAGGIDGKRTLQPADRVTLAIGRVEIEIGLVTRAAAIPKPAFDARLATWIAGAFAAHLIFLGIADVLAEPEPKGVQLALAMPALPKLPEPVDDRLPVRARRSASREKRSGVPPRPVEQVAVIEPAHHEEPVSVARGKAVATARRAGMLGSENLGRSIQAIVGTVDLDKALSEVGDIYREDEANEKRHAFGTGRNFVPAPSVPTGRFATVSTGRAVGGEYALPGEVGRKQPPHATMCTGSCTATGGNDRDVVKGAIAKYEQAIVGCYERKGGGTRGDVVIDIAIGDDGKVIHSEGAGLGDTGMCVAGVMRRVKFPKAAETTVRFPISFEP